MCGRYTENADLADLQTRYRLRSLGTEWFPPTWNTYNAAPSQILPVITGPTEAELELLGMQWGLKPRWTPKPGQKAMNPPFNARSESIFEKPMFRGLTKSKRCIVPATGFYEWRKVGGGKQPYYLTSDDGGIWSFAGLYDLTHDEDNNAAGSFTIITTTPNSLASQVHDRMPVILRREDEEAWLSSDVTEQVELEQLLRPYPAAQMQMYPVSTDVGNTRNNSPALIEPEGEIEEGV